MKRNWSITELVNFENNVAELFNKGQIKAPVHLSDGNERHLIELFAKIADEDWVFCSWRSHYQCLLKGVDEVDLLQAILDGKSIALNFPEYNLYSSAIVGGQIPIALGVSLISKLEKRNQHIWCFIGDMTSETGTMQSALRYATSHDLPITFVIEDNGISVLTDTREVWGSKTLRFEESKNSKIISYQYKSKYPHAGAGKRVQF